MALALLDAGHRVRETLEETKRASCAGDRAALRVGIEPRDPHFGRLLRHRRLRPSSSAAIAKRRFTTRGRAERFRHDRL